MAAELAAVESPVISPSGEPDEGHWLVLGNHRFRCGPRLPMGTMLKFADADGDLVVFHHLLTKLVVLEEEQTMDDVWDACDELDTEDIFAAIGALTESYSKRPTTSASDSSDTRKRTKRK